MNPIPLPQYEDYSGLDAMKEAYQGTGLEKQKALGLRGDLALYGKLAISNVGYVAGQVEVTSKCFQMCRGCESWRDDKSGAQQGEWTLEWMKTLLTQLSRLNMFEHLSLTGGDPQAWSFLEQFLDWYNGNHELDRIKLQVNTALVRAVPRPEQWHLFHDVRVSLDAIRRATYKLIRGDRYTDPLDVVRRIVRLEHKRVATITTVFPENIDEIEEMVESVDQASKTMIHPIRKMMFLPAIGTRVGKNIGFWQKYNELSKRLPTKVVVPLSFAESVYQIRQFLTTKEAWDIPCHTSRISFHAKANGDWYPCCLVGGEAIRTEDKLRIGNFFQNPSVDHMWDNAKPHRHYSNKDLPCAQICQYKQLQINLAGMEAAKTTLAMP